jgi:N-acetyl-ornithine/N-acetyl-lysine deacetylase
LLIVDEVQTGFGRTGRLFACQHYDFQPDILCLAKSLAGGVPMGAICLGQRVIESGHIARGVHGSSFGGNALACAAALATLAILEREALPERAAALGEYALERLGALRTPLIREVRGRGLLLGIELSRRVQPYLEALRERGVLALPAGPNVIRLLPPLVISEEQLEQALDVVEEVLLEKVPVGLTPVDTGFVGSTPIGPASLAPARGDTTYNKHDQDREVSLLYNMLTIPSYSCQERVLAHYLVEQTQQLGLHSYVDDVGNLIASTHPREAHTRLQPVILLGHMDTVRGYIPVRLEDGVLHGRGAVDAKGPLAAFLCAAVRIARSARIDSFQHPIMVIGAVEEESASSRGARAVVERYQPIACIIGEPSGSQAVTIGYKGRLLVEYRVTRPVHHSAGSQQNANEVAVTFWNRVSQHAAEWNEQYAPNSTFAALLPSLRSMSSDHDGLEEQVRLCIGYRLPPGYAIEELYTQLVQWADIDGASINFSGQEAAFQTTRTTPLARSFIAAIRATGGQPTFKHKTGTSDMNVVGPAWGQNIVAYGPGDSHLDHTPQEHITIAEYIHAIDVLELMLKELTLGSETTS